MTNTNKTIRRYIKRCWLIIAVMVISFAVLFSLFRALTPWARQYKEDIEQHLSILLGKSVTIHGMETSWYWFEPVLKLDQVTVNDGHHSVLKLNQLLVGINLFSSIWHWHIQPGILYLDNLHATVRQNNHQWQIEGLQFGEHVAMFDEALYLSLLSWVLSQQKIKLNNVSVMVHLQNGSLIPIEALNLSITNHSGRYRIKGNARLAQTTETNLSLLATMDLHSDDLRKANAEIYISASNILPAQWQGILPQLNHHVEGGQGDVQVWLDVAEGSIQLAQSVLRLRHLAWSDVVRAKSYFIQSISANLAWQPKQDGWRLSADQIKLEMDGMDWPVNKFLLDYHQSVNMYRLYLQHLLLRPLVHLKHLWPQALLPFLETNPDGTLLDTHVELQGDQPTYLSTQFHQLEWQSNHNIPAMGNLTGALYWQPKEGRIELASKDAWVQFQSLPPIMFTNAEAVFSWKTLSHGVRLVLEKISLMREDLLLSAHGGIDRFLKSNASHARLNIEFFAENATKWFTYIPSEYLKPKLNEWLKQDIKRIAKASGQISLDGELAHFPFDDTDGVFKINTYLRGVDLHFNKKWPLTRDIEVYLNVDKRTMEADIVRGELEGIAVKQANLLIKDIGFDKETLLIHGLTEAHASDVLKLVANSPLKQRLSKLSAVDMNGPLDLDLRLEIPLYPENDTILAKGKVVFNKNHLVFHHRLEDIELSDITGQLDFDERGVIDSAINALLFDNAIVMSINSFEKPEPYTEINIRGNTSIESLIKKTRFPALYLLQGSVHLISRLKLTNNPNDLDTAHIHSSLQGVSINLPKPFGKTFNESRPLTIDVDFNPEQAIRVRINYANRLSSDLWFDKNKSSFKLTKGELRLGSGHAILPKRKGFLLVGSLPEFDLQAWFSALSHVPSSDRPKGILSYLQYLDVKIGKAKFWTYEYQDLFIKARKQNQNDWQVYLKEPDLEANLVYQSIKHDLSGRVKRLRFEPSSFLSKKNHESLGNLEPETIPSMNLKIDSLEIGDITLGQVDCKTTSRRSFWRLDYCKITSLEYELDLEGEWRRMGKKNNTEMQGRLVIRDLAQSLKRWHITPVVEAHQGMIEFQGNWPAAVYDASLTNIHAHLNILLKDGRIKNLSRETEEKLGLGKLLSILSLKTIPRRLKLDFSDLSQTGYTYDVFKGSFVLKDGVMSTKDSYIDGPVAFASMKGDLDIANQLYNLNLRVSPHITASLPVVATIAGGPIAGIATWVASKLINHGMQKISGYTYKITGPWLNPIVQQVNIIKSEP